MKKNFLRVLAGFFLVQGSIFCMDSIFNNNNQNNQTSLNATQHIVDQSIAKLGSVGYARFGAWISLGIAAVCNSYLTYKTVEYCSDKVFQNISFISQKNRDQLVALISAVTGLPFSLFTSTRYGKLAWYFFYIIYAGERISPLLARRVLHDLHIYIQHLNTIKQVQRELKKIIEQINQVAVGLETGGPENKNRLIDTIIVDELDSLIIDHEQYIHMILEQLSDFLPSNDSHYTELFQCVNSPVKNFVVQSSSTSTLEYHAQTVVEHLQKSYDLGYDAKLLNSLVRELIEYWQNYTVGLATGIDGALKTCHSVHHIERLIVTILDRPLEFV